MWAGEEGKWERGEGFGLGTRLFAMGLCQATALFMVAADWGGVREASEDGVLFSTGIDLVAYPGSAAHTRFADTFGIITTRTAARMPSGRTPRALDYLAQGVGGD